MDDLREAHYEQATEVTDSGDAQGLIETLRKIELTGPSEEVLTLITETLGEIVPAPKTCAHETYRALPLAPEEYCEGITIPDSDYCKKHD